MLENCILSEDTVAAMRLAAAERPAGQALTTGRVLSALIRVNFANDWQRIWLHTGEPAFLDLASAPDQPAGLEPERWEGVPLSGSLASALTLLGRICEAYRLLPAPAGALALALLADPSSGAAGVLLRSGDKTHLELIALVQSALLGTTLEGVEGLLAVRPQVPALAIAATPVVANPADAAALSQPGARGPLFGWRVVSGLAVVLIGLALFWHRQFLPPSPRLILPPYPVQAVAHQVLVTDELPGAARGLGWLAGGPGRPAYRRLVPRHRAVPR